MVGLKLRTLPCQSSGGPQQPAASIGIWLISWIDEGPPVTVVVRCTPVVCGSDVAPAVRLRRRCFASRAPTVRSTGSIRTRCQAEGAGSSGRSRP